MKGLTQKTADAAIGRSASLALAPTMRDVVGVCVCVVSGLRGWSLVATSVRPYPQTMEQVSKDVGGPLTPLSQSVRPHVRFYAH